MFVRAPFNHDLHQYQRAIDSNDEHLFRSDTDFAYWRVVGAEALRGSKIVNLQTSAEHHADGHDGAAHGI